MDHESIYLIDTKSPLIHLLQFTNRSQRSRELREEL